jgi:hypothetical protein
MRCNRNLFNPLSLALGDLLGGFLLFLAFLLLFSIGDQDADVGD